MVLEECRAGLCSRFATFFWRYTKCFVGEYLYTVMSAVMSVKEVRRREAMIMVLPFTSHKRESAVLEQSKESSEAISPLRMSERPDSSSSDWKLAIALSVMSSRVLNWREVVFVFSAGSASTKVNTGEDYLSTGLENSVKHE